MFKKLSCAALLAGALFASSPALAGHWHGGWHGHGWHGHGWHGHGWHGGWRGPWGWGRPWGWGGGGACWRWWYGRWVWVC